MVCSVRHLLELRIVGGQEAASQGSFHLVFTVIWQQPRVFRSKAFLVEYQGKTVECGGKRERDSGDSQNAALRLWYFCFLLAPWKCGLQMIILVLMNCKFGVMQHLESWHRVIPKSGWLLLGAEIDRSGSLWSTQSTNLLPSYGLACVSDAVPSPSLAFNNTNAAMHSITSAAQIYCITVQQQGCFGNTMADKTSKLRSSMRNNPSGAEREIRCAGTCNRDSRR